MAYTKPGPFDRQDLKNLTTMLVQRAVSVNDGVSADKPVLNELTKNLKSIKFLLVLCDSEIKELRKQK